MKRIIIVIVIAVVLAIIGRMLYQPIIFGKITSVQLSAITTDGVGMDMSTQIENPNWLKVTITEVQLEVDINQVKIGQIVSNDTIVLQAGEKRVHEIPVVIKLTDLIGDITQVMEVLQSSQVNIKVDGFVKVKVLFINLKVKVDNQNIVSLSR